MLKPISIKMQKIIMFIPGINIFCLPIWLYNSFFYNKKHNTLLRSLYIIFSSTVPLMVLLIAVSYYFPATSDFLRKLNGYFMPLLLGYRLVKYQESLLN